MDAATREAVRAGVVKSASLALPIMFSLMAESKHASEHWPDSILDIGAGEGHWLDAAHDLRPEAWMIGLDVETFGSPKHDRLVTEWDAEARTALPDGPRKDGKWHLALCLEVIEHLTPVTGDWLVGEMCAKADRIAFSAAIPNQGGDGHLNEQWPAYWQERFNLHGYTLSDPWRLRLWSLDGCEPWYAQNLLCARPLRQSEVSGERDVTAPRHFVHPAFYESRVAERNAARGH